MVKVAHAARRHRLVVAALVTALLAAALVAAFGSSARAAVGCSITFTDGHLNHGYGDKDNWDAGRVPTSSDNVCFFAGSEVAGSGRAGTLQIRGDTLLSASATVSSIATDSEVAPGATLELGGGSISGPNSLVVPSGATLLWAGDSSMSGLGTTTIQSGGALAITSGVSQGNRALDAGRTLTIDSGATAAWSGTDNLYLGCADGTHPEALNVAGTLTIANDHAVSNCGPNLLKVQPGG